MICSVVGESTVASQIENSLQLEKCRERSEFFQSFGSSVIYECSITLRWFGVRVGSDPSADWPRPQVDLAQATRQAKDKVYALRGQPQVCAAKSEIVEKHASRAVRRDRERQHGKSSPLASSAATQLAFEF